MRLLRPIEDATRVPIRRVFWAAVWLASALLAIKASYLLTRHGAAEGAFGFVRSVAAISYLDVLFAAALFACGHLAVRLSRGRPLLERSASALVVAVAASACL